MAPRTPLNADWTPPVFVVCGKGGVGKTAVAALLARAWLDAGVRPLLLIDGDPAGGLLSAIGEAAPRTLADVRAELVAAARDAGQDEKAALADRVDYLALQALVERPDYSLLAIGRSREKGCFCPANKLLREAIDVLASPFAGIVIDAEAGLEQINREVTRHVTHALIVVDGSARSMNALEQLAPMLGDARKFAVHNRETDLPPSPLPVGVEALGAIPEDTLLRLCDCDGLPLWRLPPDAPSVLAAHAIAERLRFVFAARE
jgi:CO dehydrogenase maturation factor